MKRLSIVLSLMLLVGLLMTVSAFAESAISAQLDNSVLTVSSEAQEVTVTIKLDSPVGFNGGGGSLVIPEGFTVTSVTSGAIVTYETTTNLFLIETETTANVISDIVLVITYKVPANAAVGTYTVGAVMDELYNEDWEDVIPMGTTVTTTLTIKEATPACEHEYNYDCDTVCKKCGETTRPEAKHEYFYDCDPVCMICYELTNEDAAHSMIHVEAVAATCTSTGNIEYWYCEHCGCCWDNENADGMTLNRYMVIIPQAEHESDAEYSCQDGTCANCGADVPATAEHSSFRYDSNRNGTHNVVCGVCGETTKENVKCTPGSFPTWECPVCGGTCDHANLADTPHHISPVTVTQHVYYYICNDCECSVLVYENHTGGTATCTAQAVCEACNTAYGAKDANNHTSTEVTYVDNEDGTHTKKHACCGAVIATDEHSYVMGECYYCAHACDHSHGFSGVRYTPNGDGTHKLERQCDSCYLFIVVNEKEACSGGTATCTALAKCDACGGEYGELGEQHTDIVVNPFYNGTHYFRCDDCEEDIGEAEACTYGEDDLCTVCGMCKCFYTNDEGKTYPHAHNAIDGKYEEYEDHVYIWIAPSNGTLTVSFDKDTYCQKMLENLSYVKIESGEPITVKAGEVLYINIYGEGAFKVEFTPACEHGQLVYEANQDHGHFVKCYLCGDEIGFERHVGEYHITETNINQIYIAIGCKYCGYNAAIVECSNPEVSTQPGTCMSPAVTTYVFNIKVLPFLAEGLNLGDVVYDPEKDEETGLTYHVNEDNWTVVITVIGAKDANNHANDPVYTYKDAYEHTATYSCCEVTVDEEHKESEICTDCQAILVRVMLVGEAQIHIVFADKDGNLEIELPASELKRLYMVSANGSTNAGGGLVGDDNIISLTNLTANAVILVLDVYTGTVITNGATMSEQDWATFEMFGLKQTENGHEMFMSATGSGVLNYELYSKEGFELDYVLVNGTKYELDESYEITADGFVVELVWKCLHTTTEYVDNGNGTHSEVCGTCGEKVGEPDAHAYDTINHKCVCDKVEEFILTVIDMKGNTHTVSVPFGTNVLEAIKAMNGIDISSNKVNSDTMIGEYIFAAWVYANGEADVAHNDTVVGNVTIKPMTSANGWMKYQNGWQYHNNGAVVKNTWMEIDGAWYYFDASGFRAEGLTRVPYPTVAINGITYAANAADKAYWEAHKDTSKYSDATTAVFYFGADGKFVQYSGIEGQSYFINGMAPWHVGFVKSGNDYYYFVGDKDNGGNTMATGKIYATRDYNANMTCEGKIYFFGADGKLLQNNEGEIKDGKYYLNGELAIGLGVVQLMDENGESYFIYVRSNGELATGEYWPTTRNGLLASGCYDFGKDGRLYWNVSADYTGIKDGIYYKNGRPFYAGLIEIGGATYYINSKCEVVTGWYYVTKTNEIEIPTTKLFFGEDGKLQPVKDGIVKESDVLYYYENNHLKCGAGVVEMTDAQGNTYYIYVKSNGQLATGEYWPTTTNGLLKNAKYDWGTDGKYYPAN